MTDECPLMAGLQICMIFNHNFTIPPARR